MHTTFKPHCHRHPHHPFHVHIHHHIHHHRLLFDNVHDDDYETVILADRSSKTCTQCSSLIVIIIVYENYDYDQDHDQDYYYPARLLSSSSSSSSSMARLDDDHARNRVTHGGFRKSPVGEDTTVWSHHDWFGRYQG